MDVAQALVTVAVTLVVTGAIAAFSARLVFKKIENAPDKEQVFNMITVATLQLEQKVHSEIQTTRHELRHEMTAQLLPLNVKFEEYGKQLTQLLISVGQMQANIAHLPKRKSDMQEET